MAEEEQEQKPADIDREIEVLEQLADGSAKRHSLDPAVSDFSGGGSPEEIYAALNKWHAQGLVESSITEDGLQYSWTLNHHGLQYLKQRGQEAKTPEEIKAEELEEAHKGDKPEPQQDPGGGPRDEGGGPK